MDTKVLVSPICCLCFGSKRAIDTVLKECKNKPNLVVRGAILHNEEVLEMLKRNGIGRKDELEDFTNKDIFVVRAHGEPKKTFDYLVSKNIEYIDCTCPSVKAIHILVDRKSNEGYKIIVVGSRGKFKNNKIHAEVKGIMGWSKTPCILVEDEDDANNIDLSFDKYFLVMQTTHPHNNALKLTNIIKQKVENMGKIFEFRDTCCHAQQNINVSSLELAQKVDAMIVVGGKESNNSRELYNNVLLVNKNSFFVSNLEEIKQLAKEGKLPKGITYGLTAGASTMIESIEEIKAYLEKM